MKTTTTPAAMTASEILAESATYLVAREMPLAQHDVFLLDGALVSALRNGEVDTFEALNVWAGRLAADAESDGSKKLAVLADQVAYWAWRQANPGVCPVLAA